MAFTVFAQDACTLGSAVDFCPPVRASTRSAHSSPRPCARSITEAISVRQPHKSVSKAGVPSTEPRTLALLSSWHAKEAFSTFAVRHRANAVVMLVDVAVVAVTVVAVAVVTVDVVTVAVVVVVVDWEQPSSR